MNVVDDTSHRDASTSLWRLALAWSLHSPIKPQWRDRARMDRLIAGLSLLSGFLMVERAQGEAAMMPFAGAICASR
jgi:hypothetical protein